MTKKPHLTFNSEFFSKKRTFLPELIEMRKLMSNSGSWDPEMNENGH